MNTETYPSLQKSIVTLANLPESDDPVISAYFNLQQPSHLILEDFSTWATKTQRTLEGNEAKSFGSSVETIRRSLKKMVGKAKSCAIFARGGTPSFTMAMPFQVEIEPLMQVDSRPAIYPLVELKDRFNRFVVVLTNQESARIVEMNLGETSLQILTEKPEVRERKGREWTREHYINHSRDREKKFVKEKVEIIERLMSKRGHNALILAGEPRYVNRLREALPQNLKEKVVDQIRTGFSDERIHSVLEEAIASFLEVENNQSKDAVRRLFRCQQINGLAAFGIDLTKAVLERGQADQLIISNKLDYWSREELVRLASQHSVPIETVRDSERLDEHGGVGAFLRYTLDPVDASLQAVA